MKKKRGMDAWIGFDLDGTLAHHAPGDPIDHVGAPIIRTVQMVKNLLARGQQVRIVTARVSPEWNDREAQTQMIQAWCEMYIGARLPVQAHKNGAMVTLYDDRAIGVQRNTGIPLHELHLAVDRATAAQRIEREFYDRTGMQMDARVADALAAVALQPPTPEGTSE